MTEGKSKTTDLAKHVHGKLQHSRLSLATPPITVLEDLFECLFYTSMKTEESELVKLSVTLIDPSDPDPSPPVKPVLERWSCVAFGQYIPLEVKNLAKLSKAADPSYTSLAVYYDDEGKLFVWGMIDQAMHYQSYLNYESDSGYEQPGLFQVFITDICTLDVMFDYELLATLKQSVLVPRYLDVLTIGPVSKIIRKNADYIKTDIRNFLSNAYPSESFADWEGFVDTVWTQTFSRLLLKIQGYQHGGAILITNDFADIDIKYSLLYDRLMLAMSGYVKQSINSFLTESSIEQRLSSGQHTITKKQYMRETMAFHALTEVANEIRGCLNFIASQSCVDGLVLFGVDMVARGFGGMIRSKKMPRKIFISGTATATLKSLTATDPRHFGTRHRSMISYCWNHPGSLGLVISQDGDIRVFSKIEDKLIMWENIKVQQYQKSGKLKPKRS
ncbi:putative sensor domain DACNV-containing protein [Pedobacter ureilyticus]|uniref:Sensor domain DACNV-containing protein n=1 Tax=Pedobacter ureilyticus TaxID=1393051 RepID=A0ABW9JCF6_9SPHI|nr:hypothetical protein [Pedobacter helvus]